MTEKQENALDRLGTSVNEMSNKLFGNGTRNGCIDMRLENVENLLNTILPTIVTKAECNKRHELQWSRVFIWIALAGTWIGLLFRVMGVI